MSLAEPAAANGQWHVETLARATRCQGQCRASFCITLTHQMGSLWDADADLVTYESARVISVPRSFINVSSSIQRASPENNQVQTQARTTSLPRTAYAGRYSSQRFVAWVISIVCSSRKNCAGGTTYDFDNAKLTRPLNGLLTGTLPTSHIP